MKNEALISIVIPVYNVEKYIEKCLDSVINQTYKNLEIILVDDGSIDNSGNICDKYSKKDKRIKVIHKENGGLSSARNAGIEKAKGKYITFIDSDDFVSSDYIEYLYNLIKKYKTNISFCKLKTINDNKNVELSTKNKDYLWEKVDAFKDILYAKNFDVSACGKMYLTSQFNDIKFPIGKIFEDNDTIYKIVDKNEKIAVGFSEKYFYINRSDSITKTQFTESHLYLIDASDNMCNHLLKYKELHKAIKRKRFWARISTLNRMIESNNRNIQREKNLRKEVLKYKSVVFDRNSSFRDKISIILLMFGIGFYKKCWKFYKNTR